MHISGVTWETQRNCGVSDSSEIHAVSSEIRVSSECCHTPSVAQTCKETDSSVSQLSTFVNSLGYLDSHKAMCAPLVWDHPTCLEGDRNGDANEHLAVTLNSDPFPSDLGDCSC